MSRAQGGRDADIVSITHRRRIFAAKLRAFRAVVRWSQDALAMRTGITQRAVHRLEQGETEPRRATVAAIDRIWQAMGCAFEDLPDGAFRLTVPASALDQAPPRQVARKRDAPAKRQP